MNEILAAAALIAAQIGAPLPSDRPAVSVPAAAARETTAVSAGSGYVTAYGVISGSTHLSCSDPQGGWMGGWIQLYASMDAAGPDGTRGTIPVSGQAFLSGSCQNGSGHVTGTAQVSGTGTLYGPDGRRAGTAQLSGSMIISQYTMGYVWVNQYSSMSGYFRTDPAL